MSKYEDKVESLLRNARVYYEKEVKFEDLKDKTLLRFDFGIYNAHGELLFLLEIDGEQHFQPVIVFGGKKEFDRTCKTDRLKNKYCLMHNIDLRRVPYYDIDTLTLRTLLSNSKYKVTSKYHNDRIINGRKK